MLSVWFENAQHGIVVGAYGYAAQTQDGGQSWQESHPDRRFARRSGFWARYREALGTGDFAPHIAVLAHELHEQGKFGAVYGFAHIRRPMWSTTTVVGKA